MSRRRISIWPHQLEILELLERLNKEKQKTIVIVIHDLNMAARFSDYLVAMKDGLILHEGNVGQIMSAPVLKDVFSLDSPDRKGSLDRQADHGFVSAAFPDPDFEIEKIGRMSSRFFCEYSLVVMDEVIVNGN